MQRPGHGVPKVRGGLAVKLALEPGGVLAEVCDQVSDALPGGFEFLKDSQRGPVAGRSPRQLLSGRGAETCPDGRTGLVQLRNG
jgi:hypothetical protein